MSQLNVTVLSDNDDNLPAVKVSSRYDIVKTQAGGMGLVFLGVDTQDNRPVALKTFKPEYMANHKARDRFLQEAQTWVALGNHPNIVQAYRVESGSGPEVFLVLALITPPKDKENVALSTWLTNGQPLPLEQAFSFALHICRGMKHATTKIPGLVHRDLKPSNILVGHNGLAKIADFGLAGSWSAFKAAKEPMLVTGRAGAGSPPYMPPEQWELPGPFTPATDIYAFGCILFEFITGKTAVFNTPRGEISELREQIGKEALNEKFQQAHLSGLQQHIPVDMPPVLADILRNCLAQQPEGRYPDWAAVETDFLAAYRQLLGQETPPEPDQTATTQAETIAVGWSYHSIGASYCDLGKFKEAVPYFEQALQTGLHTETLELECMALGSLGLTAARLGQTEAGKQQLEAALLLSRRLDVPYYKGQMLVNIGAVSHPAQAVSLFDQALKIARQNHYLRLELDALGNLGNLAAATGQPQQSLEYFEQHLTLSKKTGDRSSLAQTLTNMGALYLDLGQPQQAIEALKPALTIARKNASRPLEGKVITNAAAAYYQLGDTQRALNLYEKSLNIAREIGDKTTEGQALEGMGRTSAAVGQTKQAINYLEQSIEISKAVGNIMGGAMAALNLASLLFQRNRHSDAATYAGYAVKQFTKLGHEPMQKRAENLLVEIEETQG